MTRFDATPQVPHPNEPPGAIARRSTVACSVRGYFRKSVGKVTPLLRQNRIFHTKPTADAFVLDARGMYLLVFNPNEWTTS